MEDNKVFWKSIYVFNIQSILSYCQLQCKLDVSGYQKDYFSQRKQK